MELSNFRIAEEIVRKKEVLQEQLKNLAQGSWGLGAEIKLKTGYADMGHDFTTTVKLEKDIALEALGAVKDIINRHIDALDKEFNEL